MDDRVAWAHVTIPPRVLTGGETVDDWFTLNGKLGEGQEGSINLVLSFNVSCIITTFYQHQFSAYAILPHFTINNLARMHYHHILPSSI